MAATHINTRDIKLASIKKVFSAPVKGRRDELDSSDDEAAHGSRGNTSSTLLKVPKKITKSIKVAAIQVSAGVGVYASANASDGCS